MDQQTIQRKGMLYSAVKGASKFTGKKGSCLVPQGAYILIMIVMLKTI